MSKIAIAMYKPMEGKREELLTIVCDHIPMLKSHNLLADTGTFLVESEDGTIMEIFEWKSDDAKNQAHTTPAIMGLWQRMMPICEFPHLKDLPEAHHRFPHFAQVRL